MIKLFYMSVKNAPSEVPGDISEHRKNKILSARREQAKKALTAAALVLKAGFSFLGIEEKNVKYATFENGKPYALSHPEIHFSLSHSETMAVAVFSDCPVGVDCEMADREVSLELIKRYFPKEAEEYKKNPILLWVAGESLTKLSGEGVLGVSKRTHIPPFNGETALLGEITLKKYVIKDNLVVISTKKHENVDIIAV